jgi:hypothetical protein
MKLIEAMKKIKVIEKKMAKNMEQIQNYASLPSNEKPYFENEEKQRKEVKSLIQANNDLLIEYLKIKNAIDKTNLESKIEIGGIQYSLTDLLVIKRKLAQFMIKTYNSLNDNHAQGKMRNSFNSSDGKTIHIVRFYDETDKNNGLTKWTDLYDNIDSRLEVINATTELIGYDAPVEE